MTKYIFKAWTPEEDALLLKCIYEDGLKGKWRLLSEEIWKGTRSPIQLYRHFFNVVEPLYRQSERKKTSAGADQQEVIATKQAKKRSKYHMEHMELNEEGKFHLKTKLPWTKEENERLIELVNLIGTKWNLIQEEFPHRSQSSISYVFSSLLHLINLKSLI